MFFKLARKNVTRSLKDYSVYFLTLTLGVSLFYVFNSLEGQWAMQMLAKSAHYMVWSREAPPCHITMVGSHHPLREPDLHLSMYPALLSFGQQLLTGCGLQHGIFCTQPAFYAVLQSLQPPMPACP